MSDETQVIEESNELVPVPTPEKKSKRGKGTAIAAGLAIGLGAVAYDANAEELERLIAPSDAQPEVAPSDSTDSNKPVPQDSVPSESHPAPAPAPSHESAPVALIPDHIHVLNAPETMTFDQAFEWARETAGPAQLFEWNGELYHTCHADEYALLPQETKDVFATLWIDNEADHSSVINSLEEEVVYNIDIDKNTHDIWITEDLSGGLLPPEEAVAEQDNTTHESMPQDSTSMDTGTYDFTYTEEDFDNNFDGADEWVNPDDEIA